MQRLAPLLLVGLLLGACTSQSQVAVYVTGITPLPSTLFEQRARVGLRIQNLTEDPINTTGIDLELRVNDRRLARGVSGQSLEIPRLADATASVEVSSGVFDAVRQVLGIRDRQTFNYAIKGKLFTTGIDKRFRRTGEISREDLSALVPANP